MTRSATVLDLRRGNRARVLREIVKSRETSRAQLASACGLSIATIANLVNDLLAEGAVHETGMMPSVGGRPIARLAMRPESGYFLGAGVGEHGVLVELFDLSFSRVTRLHRALPSPSAITDAVEVGRVLTETINEVRAAHPEAKSALLGIGLGVPGLVERPADGAVTIRADHLGWPAVDLGDFCAVGDLPVQAANGARALTLAEQWFGAARGVDDAVVALVGRGTGVGVIANGDLVRGTGNGAGEWGHMIVDIGGRQCVCGNRGCLEAYVGGGGIVDRWRERGGQPRETIEESLSVLLEQAAAGDRTAAFVMDETLEILGIGLANLVNLFNPERIVLGGWAGLALHSAGGPELDATIKRHALPRLGQRVLLTQSTIGPDALPLGAALLTFEQFIEGQVSM